ncbi:hypothetical protein Hanom_Chr01g00060231 [Helianthus anomalus]
MIDVLTENLDLTLRKFKIKPINDVDLLFTPIITSDHIYVVCFSIKTPKIEDLDNNKQQHPELDKYTQVQHKLVIILLRRPI